MSVDTIYYIRLNNFYNLILRVKGMSILHLQGTILLKKLNFSIQFSHRIVFF